MIVLYLGPDALLPLGSIIAAVVGFVLIFWSRIIGIVRRPKHSSDAVESEKLGDDENTGSSEDSPTAGPAS